MIFSRSRLGRHLLTALLALGPAGGAAALSFEPGDAFVEEFDTPSLISLVEDGASAVAGDFRVIADLSRGGFVQIGDRPGAVEEGDSKVFAALGGAFVLERADGAPFFPTALRLAGATLNAESNWAASIVVTGFLDGVEVYSLTRSLLPLLQTKPSFALSISDSDALDRLSVVGSTQPPVAGGPSSDGTEFSLLNLRGTQSVASSHPPAGPDGTEVPLPGAAGLLALGAAALGLVRRRRRG